MGTKAFIGKLLKPLGLGVFRLGTKYQEQHFIDAALRYKKAVVTNLAVKANYTVVRGPFVGLRLPEMGAWSDYDLLSKIVGSYEAEIFPALEREIGRSPNAIINIGASEGYYAIGLKRLLPNSLVYTFDIDHNSFSVLDGTAKMNGVEVVRLASFDYANPLAGLPELETIRPLFVMDCEGYENNVVNMPYSVSANSSFIIELHDLFVPGTKDRLLKYFEGSHVVEIIDQRQRQLADYPELDEVRGPIASVVVDEFRGAAMQWLYAVPK